LSTKELYTKMKQNALVLELVDKLASGASASNGVGVRVSPGAHIL